MESALVIVDLIAFVELVHQHASAMAELVIVVLANAILALIALVAGALFL